jgi:hypothetical protein
MSDKQTVRAGEIEKFLRSQGRMTAQGTLELTDVSATAAELAKIEGQGEEPEYDPVKEGKRLAEAQNAGKVDSSLAWK